MYGTTCSFNSGKVYSFSFVFTICLIQNEKILVINVEDYEHNVFQL